MSPYLTEDQRLIRDEAVRLLEERSPPEAVRRIVEAGGGTDSDLWSTMGRELGWCAMAIPEQYGGLGLGLTELALLMEAAGARLACVPLWATACLAAPLILAAARQEAQSELLPAIASGELAATAAWGDIGSVDPLRSRGIVAKAISGGYVLDGVVAHVVDLEAADLILVPATLDDGAALFALRRHAGQTVRGLKVIDATRPMGELRLSALAVPAAARIDHGELSPQLVDVAMATANLTLAAEEAGAARGVMDLTLAYISGRVQFGRTISSFQAVKHRCARLEVDLAEARALIYGAAAAFSSEPNANHAIEVAGARALASDLLFRAAEESIQLHGGVGFTWEYDAHLYLKRAQASSRILGNPEAQLERIADAVMGDAR